MTTFDLWNILKKKVNGQDTIPNAFPKEGEVWMVYLGKNIGFEQNGGGADFSRPVLVIKKFNNHMFWTIPLSTKQKSFNFYYNYVDPNGQQVAAILAQMKLTSIKRFQRKLYALDASLVGHVKQKLKLFL